MTDTADTLIRCARCSRHKLPGDRDWQQREVATRGQEHMLLGLCPRCAVGLEPETAEEHDRQRCDGKYVSAHYWKAECKGPAYGRRTCGWKHSCWDQGCVEQAADAHAEAMGHECDECGQETSHEADVIEIGVGA